MSPDRSDRDDGAREEGQHQRQQGPREPASWRDLARADYEYPDELTGLSRRERRRAMRAWRQDDQAQRAAWLRNQRQAEPSSPVVVIVAVVLLAVVILGLGGGLPKLLGRGNDQQAPVGLLTPSAPVDLTEPSAEPTQAATATPTSSPTLSVPPILTERPSAQATTVASHVTNLWAHTFYTRNPVAETYAQLVGKVEPYVTAEVAESLVTGGDPTYDSLRLDGGKSSVISAPVTAPRPGSAPVDTPTRISRLVTVTIDITGKNPDRIKLPLLVTLIPQEGKWVISEINGGTGP
ncbi:hypothetical protein [Kribbella deserti]|uniref:Conjugative transposon protein TcpC n=1 Tax=Kribbella deserti TaxID=1926257 RepID=A0ABV6QED0_9ACTN